MKYAIYVMCSLIALAVLFLIGAFIVRINKKKNNKMTINDFVVCASPKMLALVIAVSIIFALILFLLNYFDDIRVVADSICIVFMVFILFACYAVTREKTIIKDDNIKHIPIFGRKKEIKFSDIKYIQIQIKENIGVYLILIGHDEKKIFSLSPQNMGMDLFLDKIEESGIEVINKG